jgi:hypothetical protein
MVTVPRIRATRLILEHMAATSCVFVLPPWGFAKLEPSDSLVFDEVACLSRGSAMPPLRELP